MNEELLKSLLRIKINLVRGVAGFLPEPYQTRAKESEAQVLRVILEVGREYLENDRMTDTERKEHSQTGGVQSIIVE